MIFSASHQDASRKQAMVYHKTALSELARFQH